jgi:3-dehydroquinate synthase
LKIFIKEKSMISKAGDKNIKVKAARGEYAAVMGNMLDFDDRSKKGKRVFVVDRNILKLYPEVKKKIGREPLFEFSAIENNKSLDFTVKRTLPWLQNQGVKRSDKVVAIGGGITQDAVGFACSLWLRGVPWIFYPTTLLAQADSCIGSKTSINYGQAKNILGTFYPPMEVVIDRNFLGTLKEIDFRSGVGEILKVHLLQSRADSVRLAAKLDEIQQRKPESLEAAIGRSLVIKKKLIEKDEFDQGIRNILNYGHCVGHALEAASGYRMAHGLAVVYGMMTANVVSRYMGMIDQKEMEEMNALLLRNAEQKTIAAAVGFEEILPYLRKDKKNVGAKITMILTRGRGRMERYEGVKPSVIKRAWGYVIKEI